MANERFEVRLTPEEVRRVHDDMRLLGKRKRADYLRDCLLAGSAGRAEDLSHALGSLAIGVSELLLLAQEMRVEGTGSSLPPEVARLTGRLLVLVKKAQTLLAAGAH